MSRARSVSLFWTVMMWELRKEGSTYWSIWWPLLLRRTEGQKERRTTSAGIPCSGLFIAINGIIKELNGDEERRNPIIHKTVNQSSPQFQEKGVFFLAVWATHAQGCQFKLTHQRSLWFLASWINSSEDSQILWESKKSFASEIYPRATPKISKGRGEEQTEGKEKREGESASQR